MRKADLRLRTLAEQGDHEAAVELGLKYLHGAPGMSADHRRALHYLAAEASQRRDIAHGLASEVALEDLLKAGALPVLESAALDGLAIALAKLGAFKALRGESGGWDLLATVAAQSSQCADAYLADLLHSSAFSDGRLLAETLLRNNNDGDQPALRALAAALAAYPNSTNLSYQMLGMLVRASESTTSLQPLTQTQIEQGLRLLCDHKDPVAAVILGSALAGLDVGTLRAQDITARSNHREGFALLLRAAHYGETRAWYQLYLACSDYRTTIANAEAAQFFLEQAAEANISQAARTLGAKTLRGANNLNAILRGQRLLLKAAAAGDMEAHGLLASFYGAHTPAPLDAASQHIIATASALSPGIGVRLALARAFSLSRDEAARLDLADCIRGSSVLVTKHYALPALSVDAAAALQKAKAWVLDSRAQAAPRQTRDDEEQAMDSIFKSCGIEPRSFFQDSDKVGPRSMSTWRAKNSVTLRHAAASQSL